MAKKTRGPRKKKSEQTVFEGQVLKYCFAGMGYTDANAVGKDFFGGIKEQAVTTMYNGTRALTCEEIIALGEHNKNLSKTMQVARLKATYKAFGMAVPDTLKDANLDKIEEAMKPKEEKDLGLKF